MAEIGKARTLAEAQQIAAMHRLPMTWEARPVQLHGSQAWVGWCDGAGFTIEREGA